MDPIAKIEYDRLEAPEEFDTKHFAECPANYTPESAGLCTCDEIERDLRAEFRSNLEDR